MILRDAIQIIRSARLSANEKVCIVCSFEPLHLKTYIQAFIAEQQMKDVPEVIDFGFDQLEIGLQRTAEEYDTSPVLVFLAWSDIHPQLSWRTRGSLVVEPDEITKFGLALLSRLESWIETRRGSESYFLLPPIEWLPLVDSVNSCIIGERVGRAISILAKVVDTIMARDGRVLTFPGGGLNFRDFLAAGCPLSLEASERIAKQFVEVAFRANDRKKILVTDLDNTLWSGVVGEDGPEKINYNSEGAGFPFNVYQKFLLKLKSEGVLLAFCSKNNEDDVLPVFDALDMPLHLDDFVSYSCNWHSKFQNLKEIVGRLNIGLDSVVFIDDSPVELSEIEANAPEVTCIKTPGSGQEWQGLFNKLQALFAVWKPSDEDRVRTDFFKQADHRERRTVADPKQVIGLKLTHVRTLGLKLKVHLGTFAQDRSLELVNKTNQFNLHGERMSVSQWLELSNVPGSFCLAASLEDRYGSFGVIAVIVGEVGPDKIADIKQMVLSCRAFGRGVEHVLLHCLVQCLGLNRMVGRFVDTGRNFPALDFLKSIGCDWNAGVEWSISGERVIEEGEQKIVETGMAYLIEDCRDIGE